MTSQKNKKRMVKLILTIVVCGTVVAALAYERKGSGSSLISAKITAVQVAEQQFLGFRPMFGIGVWGDLVPEPTKEKGAPQSTQKDYRFMVVMRDVLTKSTHPP